MDQFQLVAAQRRIKQAQMRARKREQIEAAERRLRSLRNLKDNAAAVAMLEALLVHLRTGAL